MADQKPVAKTDTAAVITDNKSGVPDRPTKVSQNLKNEQAVYQRDVLGKKDVPLPVATEESAGSKKHEMTNLLQREEARLQKIGQHLDKPELLEQKLREHTTKGESGISSTTNIKTDTHMRMTDDVRGLSPDQNAGPRGQQAPAGGVASSANIKTDTNMRMTDDVRGLSPDQNAGPRGQQAPAGGAGGQQPPGGAPMKLPSKENVAAGKATGTSYATDGNYPKTDTDAVITDNRSKMSKTAQEELKRQEESYARDRLLRVAAAAAMAQGPPVTNTQDTAPPGRSGHASMQQGGSMPQGGRMSMQQQGTGGGTGGSRRGSQRGLKVITATPDPEEETTTTSEEQLPGMTYSLMPECVQRVIDSGMEKIYGPRPRRPYRPPMLDMEVEEDNDYDPYFLRIEAVQAVYKQEKGRVMYPSQKHHKSRRPKEQDCDFVFQDELVISSGGSVAHDNEVDSGCADEGNMRDEQTEDVLYVEDIVYQGGQNGCMMQPAGQAVMQPMMQPMMWSPSMQPMGQPIMQPMAQPMMMQMGQPTMQPLVVQSMSAQNVTE